MTETAKRRSVSWTSLAIGLVIGLLVGAGGAFTVLRPAEPDPWIEAAPGWIKLPEQTPAGGLPQTFAIPAAAYDYAAISRPLGPLLQARPSILRVDLEVAAGRAGVSLARPDGQSLVSPERSLNPQQGRSSLYFALAPQQGPVAILIRNYDSPGAAGSVTVHSVSYAREDALSPEAVAEINKAG